MTRHAEQTIRKQAHQWLAELASGDATDELRTEFERWCSADVRHGVVYRQVADVFYGLSDIDELAGVEPLDNLTLQERIVAFVNNIKHGFNQWSQKPVWWAGAGMATALVLMVVLLGPDLKPGASERQQQYYTGAAETREVSLADGSVVVLGGRSAITADFSKAQRQVRLSQGQAWFNVSADPERPFVVTVAATRVTVIGTEFDIRKGADEVRIAVTEGAVNVAQTNSTINPPAKVKVTAGQQVVAAKAGSLSAVQDVGNEYPGAWRDGRLIYVNTSLKEIVADANRYSETAIVLQNEELGDLRVTAGFRTDQIDDMLDTLATVLPIEVARGLGDNIFIKHRQ